MLKKSQFLFQAKFLFMDIYLLEKKHFFLFLFFFYVNIEKGVF